MAVNLLDYLVLNTSASYISDLRFRPIECACALEALEDPERFALDDWNHAGSYLSSAYEPQAACGDARSAVLAVLSDRA